MRKRNREEEEGGGLDKGGPVTNVFKKRTRDESEIMRELSDRVTQLQEELKKVKASKDDKPGGGVLTNERLAGDFTKLLRTILREDGIKIKQVDDELVQFTGVIRYPNDLDIQELQQALINTDEGIASVVYECNGHRNMKFTISHTYNKALKMQYLAQDQRESQQYLNNAQQEKQGDVTIDEASLVLFTLKSNLMLDTKCLPTIQSRTIGEGIQVVSVTVAVQSPLKNHQLDSIIARQSRKLKSLRLGAHPDQATLRLTVEIYCCNNNSTPSQQPQPQQQQDIPSPSSSNL
jgi:hypothetical protein